MGSQEVLEELIFSDYQDPCESKRVTLELYNQDDADHFVVIFDIVFDCSVLFSVVPAFFQSFLRRFRSTTAPFAIENESIFDCFGAVFDRWLTF